MKKKNYRFIVFILLLFISIGFSIITSTLNIVGSTNVSKNSWDIHFENVKVVDGSVVAATPVIDNNDARVRYSVTLNMPGDFYEFTVDVVNDGTIDGMLDSLDKTTLTSDQLKYLNYYVTYSDGVEIKADDILRAGKSEKLLVHIDYKKDLNSSDLPLNDVNLTINIQANYKQADENANNVSHSVIEIVNKLEPDKFNVGDEIKIGEEHFYYINSSSNTYNFLAKYNLNVGSRAISGTQGIQNENCIGGSVYDSVGYSCTIEIADTRYWYSEDSGNYADGFDYMEPYCIDSRCNMYNYIQNYKSYLESNGGVIHSISMLSAYYMDSLGCNDDQVEPGTVYCNSSPSWLTDTSYWLEGLDSPEYAYAVDSHGLFYFAAHDSYYGIRPFISLDKNLFN